MDFRLETTSGSETDSEDSLQRKESINANVRRMNMPALGSNIDITVNNAFSDENVDLTVFEAAREGSEEKIRKQVMMV